jgi:hypothetical protein
VEAARRVIDISGVTKADPSRTPGTRSSTGGSSVTVFRSCSNEGGIGTYCVIGGWGAFMVPIRERQQFVEAVRTKLVREISESRPQALMQPAQSEPRVNCFAGEIASDGWMRN